jgi:hypothetical protein
VIVSLLAVGAVSVGPLFPDAQQYPGDVYNPADLINEDVDYSLHFFHLGLKFWLEGVEHWTSLVQS